MVVLSELASSPSIAAAAAVVEPEPVLGHWKTS